MHRYAILTSYATSLQVVANDIAYVLGYYGESADVYKWHLLWIDLKARYDRAVIIIPFDPIYAHAWLLSHRDYVIHGVPTITYTTVEGLPKQKLIQDWVKRDVVVVANSEYTKKMLEKVGIRVVGVIPHGVNYNDVRMAEPNKQALKEADKAKVVIGVVSSGAPRKGLRHFSAVADKVFKKTRDVKFHVLTDKTGITQLAGLLNAVPDRRFGKMNRIQVLSMIGSFDFLLVPSMAEGFGLPALEAMALGVPVIHLDYDPLSTVTTPRATIRVPVTEEKFVDDGYGILYHYHYYKHEDMVSAIVEAVDIYLNQKSLYEDMSSKAMEHAKKYDALITYKPFIKQ